MSDYSIILQHPDKEEILTKLYSGSPPKDVNQWLRIKYNKPEQGHLKISVKHLQEFVDNHKNLYDTLKTDIQEQKDGKIKKTVAKSLLESKTYEEHLTLLAKNELDLKQEFLNTIHIVKVRVEQLFDLIQQDPQNTKKADYILIKWMEILGTMYERYDKSINQAPDMIVQHNVTFQALEQHTAIFQESIRKILSRLSPELTVQFLEEFNRDISALRPPKEELPISQEQRILEVKNFQLTNQKLLEEKIE